MTRTFALLLSVFAAAAVWFGTGAAPAAAADPPGKLTFLAAACPASSSMYQRVAAGQDPNSGENGSPAVPADIAAYGCTPSSGLGFFLLAGSTANSVFLDDALTTAATLSPTTSSAGAATIIPSGTTTYVPGGIAQTRRISVSNYPTTITTRAAMPFLDLQCLTDGYNSDNADGAGWNNQAIPAGGQAYCIAYVWDGVEPTATPTATPTAAPSPTATPTAASSTVTVTVNFPGLSSAHVYLHAPDGVARVAGGMQKASSTWKTDSTTFTAAKGKYDLRIVHGPMTTIIDDVDCSADCTVDVPLAKLTVNFPGMSSVHSYAHADDGQPGSVGAQDSSSTWKTDTTTMTLLRGMYDVRVVHGPMTSVFDGVDCRGEACQVDVPLAKLTVNFPGMSSVHSYAHADDGQPGSVGAQDSSSTWKTDTTTMTLLRGMYDVRVVHGPMTSVFDAVDCRGETCQVDVPLAKLTVNFPGHSNVHTYVRKDDGASSSAGGEQDSSSTWKTNSTSLTLFRGVYDVVMQEGSDTYIVDAVDCRGETCTVTMPGKPSTVTPTATPAKPTATPEKPSDKKPFVKKTFVKASDDKVVWKLEPSEPADMRVWDANAETCEEFLGAACGDIGKGDYGKFYKDAGDKQYMLVTQSFKKDGESCKVKNTAEWQLADDPNGERQSVDASYVCSGAPTMGWPLFGLFAAGALGMTWVARRKLQ